MSDTIHYRHDVPLAAGQWVAGCKVLIVTENFATLTGLYPLRAYGIQDLYDGGWEVIHPPVLTTNHPKSTPMYEITLKRMVDGL